MALLPYSFVYETAAGQYQMPSSAANMFDGYSNTFSRSYVNDAGTFPNVFPDHLGM